MPSENVRVIKVTCETAHSLLDGGMRTSSISAVAAPPSSYPLSPSEMASFIRGLQTHGRCEADFEFQTIVSLVR
jgi:hypothetical protein